MMASMRAPRPRRWQSTAQCHPNDDLRAALARAKQAGRGEKLEAVRLARERLAAKDMSSREAMDAINILKLAGDATGCIAVLRDLQARGLRVSIFLFNAAISACGKGGQWQRALELLEEMGREGVERDTITYSATISACKKGGQWQRALDDLGVREGWAV